MIESPTCPGCMHQEDDCMCDASLACDGSPSTGAVEQSQESAAVLLLMRVTRDRSLRLSQRGLAAVEARQLERESDAPDDDRISVEAHLRASIRVLLDDLEIDGEQVDDVTLECLASTNIGERLEWRLSWDGSGWGVFSQQSPNIRAKGVRAQLHELAKDLGLDIKKGSDPSLRFVLKPSSAVPETGTAEEGLVFDLEDVDALIASKAGGLPTIEGRPATPVEHWQTMHPEYVRELACEHYEHCLDHAIVMNWNGFSCQECPLAEEAPKHTPITEEHVLLNLRGRKSF